jgi:GNAT superfamily N-acetyltransferase
LQTFPDDWDPIFDLLLGNDLVQFSEDEDKKKNKIELNTRVNFKFNRGTYLNFKQNNITSDFKIVRTDKDIFNNMKGSVVPIYFWSDAEHFCNKGIGYSLFYENKLASTAYSAYVHDNFLEIGIETFEEYRGKGLAQYSCAALIDFCLENNLEPVWSCRLENTASYILAQKLGFEPTSKRRYYRLCK